MLGTIGDFEAWTEAASWAARFHQHFSLQIDSLPARAPHLLRYGAAYYRRWMPRAMAFTGGDDSKKRQALKHLARRHESFVTELSELPVSLIHGEFYANNIMVEQKENGIRVCPVDWEMAAIGPGLFDLAAVSAFWKDAPRRALACAYHVALAATCTEPPDLNDILRQVDMCSLQMAVQWLGWSRRWWPRRERDWLSEIARLVERLDL
jgi:aminoglycoside/choline kinase family phosphotransferase